MMQIAQHETVLKNILAAIYTDPRLQASLGFKGGTALYLFYGLDRFSVDLDFNVLAETFNPDALTHILLKSLSVTDRADKRNTWFWIGSYEKAFQKVKVEVSKREYPDTYAAKDFYGLTVTVMNPDCMFAHKLCAITDRKRLQSRDLYDAHFMFRKNFPINEEIIRLRTGKSVQQYFDYLISFIEQSVTSQNILEGLGELLESEQKDSVRATLKRDILFDLRSRLSY